MELGIHLANFTWSGGPATFVTDLARTAKLAEDVGVRKLSVMDHVWQIGHIGPPEHEMLEAYTTLGYLAAVTEKVELLAWVTAAVYREPGLLAKEVTTLDVLSRRSRLARHRRRVERGGVPRPRPAVPAHGRAVRAARGDTPDLPADVERQRRALRGEALPARPDPELTPVGAAAAPPDPHRRRRREEDAADGGAVCDACNLFDTPELPRKLDILREHCESLGRDYDEIAKTVMYPVDPGPNGEYVDAVLAHLKDLAALGVTHVHSRGLDGSRPDWLEVLGEQVIPEISRF